MFVIPTGEVTVTQHNALGRDQPIVTHPPGSFMAELAQLSGRPSLVDAHAIRPVERGRPSAARAPRAAQGGEAAAALACAPPAALLLDHRRLPRPVGGAPGVPPRVREGGEEGGPHARPGRRRWVPPPRCALHPPTASATPTRPSTSRRGRTSYYVSRMLGHADISLTVHTYGAWLQLHRRTGRGGGAGGAGVMPLANAASRRLLAAVTVAAPLASSLPAPDAVCKQAASLLPAARASP